MRTRKLMSRVVEEQTAKRQRTRDELARDGALPRKDAAKFIGVSVDTLDEYLAKHALPRVKVGRIVSVPVVALRDFLAARIQHPDLAS